MSTSLYVPVLCQPPEVLYMDGLPGGEGLSGAQVHHLQLALLVPSTLSHFRPRWSTRVDHPMVPCAQDLNQQLVNCSVLNIFNVIVRRFCISRLTPQKR